MHATKRTETLVYRKHWRRCPQSSLLMILNVYKSNIILQLWVLDYKERPGTDKYSVWKVLILLLVLLSGRFTFIIYTTRSIY